MKAIRTNAGWKEQMKKCVECWEREKEVAERERGPQKPPCAPGAAVKWDWSNRFCLSGTTTQWKLLEIWGRFGSGLWIFRERWREKMSKSNTVWSGSVAAVLHLGVFSDQLLMRLMVILSIRVAGGGGGVIILWMSLYSRSFSSLSFCLCCFPSPSLFHYLLNS